MIDGELSYRIGLPKMTIAIRLAAMVQKVPDVILFHIQAQPKSCTTYCASSKDVRSRAFPSGLDISPPETSLSVWGSTDLWFFVGAGLPEDFGPPESYMLSAPKTPVLRLLNSFNQLLLSF